MIYSVAFLAVVAYLLGSIPSAVWIGKHFYGVDIRQHGSRNAGTTNMLRVLGRRAALPVFVIDFLKGFVAVTLPNLVEHLPGATWHDIYNIKILLVVMVVLGHIFPVFAGFKGGKGVATLAGAVMGVAPTSVLLCLAVWVVVLMTWHYVSLASMVAGVFFPVFIYLSPRTNGSPSMVVFSIVVAVLLIITHRKNIGRLRAGIHLEAPACPQVACYQSPLADLIDASSSMPSIVDSRLNSGYTTITSYTYDTGSPGMGATIKPNEGDTDKTLFIPNAGYRINSSGARSNDGSQGRYWPAEQYPSNTANAWRLYFTSTYTSGTMGYGAKLDAMSIRCVRS